MPVKSTHKATLLQSLTYILHSINSVLDKLSKGQIRALPSLPSGSLVKTPQTIRPLSLRHKAPHYTQGFYVNLFRDIIKKVASLVHIKPSLLKGRFSFKLSWEHMVIAFLLGLLLMKSAPTHIIRDTYVGISPAPAILSIKPLPLLKVPSYKPVTALDTVYVNKLRPYGTYGGADYVPGQCTFGVAQRLPIPPSWGNANNWAYSAALAGYTVSNVPKEGSVAQTGGDSWAGHVAVTEAVYPDGSFLIWEMNGAGGPGSTDERVTTTAEFPNFIYIP